MARYETLVVLLLLLVHFTHALLPHTWPNRCHMTMANEWGEGEAVGAQRRSVNGGKLRARNRDRVVVARKTCEPNRAERANDAK